MDSTMKPRTEQTRTKPNQRRRLGRFPSANQPNQPTAAKDHHARVRAPARVVTKRKVVGSDGSSSRTRMAHRRFKSVRVGSLPNEVGS
jgi:hypothetical protein